MRIPLFCLSFALIFCITWSSLVSAYKDPVVQLFQKYVRINTTTNADLGLAVEFWKKLAEEENVPISVHEFVAGYPVVVLRWPGTDPSLPSIMLNSHMDVVPADEDKKLRQPVGRPSAFRFEAPGFKFQDGWKYPPFSGHIDNNGDMYGRGTQDMKSVSIQQFEALRRLKSLGAPLLRNVYMTLMPDEETGGKNGMVHFVKSKQFAEMNVGVEMDEGWAQPDSSAYIFYNNKAVWQFRVDCYGVDAHGAILLPLNVTASGKCLKFTNNLFEFREEQSRTAGNDGLFNAGDFTSVNLNMLTGGSATNTIPGHVSLIFDVRLAVRVDEKQLLAQLNQWISDAGDNITLTFLVKDVQTPSSTTDKTDPYWSALTTTLSEMNISMKPLISAGATDGRYLRVIGIPSYGFSPMLNTPLLPHKVNERLNVAVFLKGVDIYEKIVKNLANAPSS